MLVIMRGAGKCQASLPVSAFTDSSDQSPLEGLPPETTYTCAGVAVTEATALSESRGMGVCQRTLPSLADSATSDVSPLAETPITYAAPTTPPSADKPPHPAPTPLTSSIRRKLPT